MESTADQENKPKILLVDDTAGDLNIIKLILKAKYKVHTAANGQLAILEFSTQIMSGRIKLILTDCNMPKMNGIELITYIREKLSETVPIIISSAKPDCAKSAVEAGATGRLDKPINCDDLNTAIELQLQPD